MMHGEKAFLGSGVRIWDRQLIALSLKHTKPCAHPKYGSDGGLEGGSH